MPGIVWDKIGDRVYETGLSNGVLYLPDGSAVPWNGLTSIIEKFNKEVSPIYYDGMKINDLVALGDFSATLKAVTYPDEFIDLEGLVSLREGVFLGDQKPKTFGLCYRTIINNDVVGDSAGYKLHIIYNLTAIPSDKTYSSIAGDPALVEFEWEITAVPEEFPGFRPTAHLIIDSRDMAPLLLQDLEKMLYGDSESDAVLLPMSDLIQFMKDWALVRIVDHGDGTWSAISDYDGFISLDIIEQLFTLTDVNAVYLDSVTYEISDTNSV